MRKFLLIFLLMLTLVGCTVTTTLKDSAPRHHVDVSTIRNPTPKAEAKSRYGNPKSYVVNNKRYSVLDSAENYSKRGTASWYGTKFHGQLTSTREPYNMLAMTAASPELPLPTYVRVRNLLNNKMVIVRVNDRGPFAPGRILDLSYAAAKKLGFANRGTAPVEVTALTTHHNAEFDRAISIQAGAFRNYQNALQLKSRLTTLTQLAINIVAKRKNGAAMYLVNIGPFASAATLQSIQSLLKTSGISAIITRNHYAT